MKLLHKSIHIQSDFVLKELVLQRLLPHVGPGYLEALLVLAVVLGHLSHLANHPYPRTYNNVGK